MVLTHVLVFFFLMIRRPPRSTLDRSSAASDVYKRQIEEHFDRNLELEAGLAEKHREADLETIRTISSMAVSYTHLRAHETVLDLVCRLLLEKKKNQEAQTSMRYNNSYLTPFTEYRERQYEQKITTKNIY